MFLFVVVCSLVIFTYTGHDVHRRGHGRRRPLRGLSVAFRDAIDATPARRRGGAGRSLRRSAAATRLGVARGMDSNIGQVTGVAPGSSDSSWPASHQCGPCAPWSRASASACVKNHTVQGRSKKAERSLKPPPTLPTRLALGLALLGLLPSPEVVVPIILVRRRRAPVRRVVALVEAPAAALARRQILGPRLLAAVADLRETITQHRQCNVPCASPSCRSDNGRSASCPPSAARLCVFLFQACGRRPCCGCGSSSFDDAPRSGRAAAGSAAPRRLVVV